MADWVNEQDPYDDDGPVQMIQCSECPNHEQAGEFAAQELIADGWLLEPVVYCPKHGPDEGELR